MAHQFKTISPGMYDSLKECIHCSQQYTDSADNPASLEDADLDPCVKETRYIKLMNIVEDPDTVQKILEVME